MEWHISFNFSRCFQLTINTKLKHVCINTRNFVNSVEVILYERRWVIVLSLWWLLGLILYCNSNCNWSFFLASRCIRCQIVPKSIKDWKIRITLRKCWRGLFSLSNTICIPPKLLFSFSFHCFHSLANIFLYILLFVCYFPLELMNFGNHLRRIFFFSSRYSCSLRNKDL